MLTLGGAALLLVSRFIQQRLARWLIGMLGIALIIAAAWL
jgi:hypothetical protein